MVFTYFHGFLFNGLHFKLFNFVYSLDNLTRQQFESFPDIDP
jgi:hypothetical protein